MMAGGLGLILNTRYLVSKILNVVIFVTNGKCNIPLKLNNDVITWILKVQKQGMGHQKKVTKMKFKIINNYSVLRVQTDVTVNKLNS